MPHENSIPRRRAFGLVRRYALGIIGAWVIIEGASCVPSCNAQNIIDITNDATIAKSGLVFNRQTNTFNSVVTVKNTSAQVLNAPLILVVSDLTPSTVTLANQSGQEPSGNPFISLTVP